MGNKLIISIIDSTDIQKNQKKELNTKVNSWLLNPNIIKEEPIIKVDNNISMNDESFNIKDIGDLEDEIDRAFGR